MAKAADTGAAQAAPMMAGSAIAGASSGRAVGSYDRAAASPFRHFLVLFAASFMLSFGSIWIYVAVFPMAFMDRDYPIWLAKQSMLNDCVAEGSVAVFGDSRTVAGIAPSAMPFPTINFALSGTSPLESYLAVSRVLACPRPPRLVVLANGGLKFSSDSDYWRFTAHDGMLDFAGLREVEQTANRLHDSSLEDPRRGDGLSPWLRDLAFSVRFPTLYFSNLVHGYVFGRFRHNLAAEEETLRQSGHMLFGTAPGFDGLAGEAFPTRFTVAPVIDNYFTRTLEMLTERHVPVVFLSMPINEATYARMSSVFRLQFADYLHAQARRFPNVLIQEPVVPCWPDAFYGDAWHMNKRGAEAFSREFGAWLQPVLSQKDPGPMPDHCRRAG